MINDYTVYIGLSTIWLLSFLYRKVKSAVKTSRELLPKTEREYRAGLYLKHVRNIIKLESDPEEYLKSMYNRLEDELNKASIFNVNYAKEGTQILTQQNILVDIMGNLDAHVNLVKTTEEDEVKETYAMLAWTRIQAERLSHIWASTKMFVPLIIAEVVPIITMVLGYRELSMLLFVLCGYLYLRLQGRRINDSNSIVYTYIMTQVPYLVGLIFLY